ncbi:MAG: MarR family transcriptional regulator, partial [Methanomicrobium sp.]|nr:MarR family transcriptional regulator [Methanomicrobium sp.]
MLCLSSKLLLMISAEDLMFLKKIGLMGGFNGQVAISSQKLGDSLKMSAMTVSRRLNALEKENLIVRSV